MASSDSLAFVCCACQSEFVSPLALQAHLKDANHFQRHQRGQSAKHAFPCLRCGKVCGSKSLLATHTNLQHRAATSTSTCSTKPGEHLHDIPDFPASPDRVQVTRLGAGADFMYKPLTRAEEVAIVQAKRAQILSGPTELPHDMRDRTMSRQHVLLDVDNVLFSIRFSHINQDVAGAPRSDTLRLNVRAFTRLVCRTELTQAAPTMLRAIYSSSSAKIADVFKLHGWTVQRQSVNDRRNTLMVALALLVDTESSPQAPAPSPTRIVLITGDGAVLGFAQSAFRDRLRGQLARNVIVVDVYAWLHTLHSSYIDLHREFPHQFRIHALNDYIPLVVMNGETANQVSWTSTTSARAEVHTSMHQVVASICSKCGGQLHGTIPSDPCPWCGEGRDHPVEANPEGEVMDVDPLQLETLAVSALALLLTLLLTLLLRQHGTR